MKILGTFKDDVYPFSYIDHNRHVVRGIIINDNNEVVMINVTRDDIFGNATYYETPGGGINPRENIIKALKRELVEEVGLEVEVIQEIGTIEDDYNLIHRHNISTYYLVKAIGEVPTHREEYETHWFTSVDKINIDKLIEIEKHPLNDIARIVYRRECVILEEAKRILENRK